MMPPEIEPGQELKLTWNNYQSILTKEFFNLRSSENFVDVTIVCDQKPLHGHKIVLSACSPYFKKILADNPCQHPIILLDEGHYENMRYILEFIYTGEVKIQQCNLTDLLNLAESLQIRGLGNEKNQKETNDTSSSQCKKHKLSTEQNSIFQTNRMEVPYESNYNEMKRSRREDYTDENIETSPHHDYSILEPKTEILDEPPEHGFDNYTCDRSCSPYGTSNERVPSHSSFHQNRNSPTKDNNRRSCGTSPDRNQNSSSPPASSLSSLQGLMKITGRLKEIQPIRNTMTYPRSIDMPRGREGFCENSSVRQHYLQSEIKSTPEMSLVPYTPRPNSNYQSSTTPYSSYAAPHRPRSPQFHSLDSRYCKICGKNYSNLSNLRQHIRLIHIPEVIICPLCRKCFKNKLYLRRHVLSFHEKITF